MNNNQTLKASPTLNRLTGKWAEQIAVVNTKNLFLSGTWQGLKTTGLEEIIKTIQEQKEFLPRGLAETNVDYKQIIPYVVFKFQDQHNQTNHDLYFLMQRKATASESRLAHNYSLGIGGHLREKDLKSASVFDWAQREFNEEINYTDPFTIELIGMINDDSNEVGQVHLGLVMVVTGSTKNISIKSELKNGQLLTLDECNTYYNQMETWTQIVFDTLKK